MKNSQYARYVQSAWIGEGVQQFLTDISESYFICDIRMKRATCWMPTRAKSGLSLFRGKGTFVPGIRDQVLQFTSTSRVTFE